MQKKELQLRDFIVDGEVCIHIPRMYFDAFCHEFKGKPVDEKINILAFLVYNGWSLHEYIMEYQDTQNERTLESLSWTLVYYINNLRWKNIYTTSLGMERLLSQVELALLLEKELRLRYCSYSQTVTKSRWGKEESSEIVRLSEKSSNPRAKCREFILTTAFSEIKLGKKICDKK